MLKKFKALSKKMKFSIIIAALAGAAYAAGLIDETTYNQIMSLTL